jgi:tape measure domain-containing protein
MADLGDMIARLLLDSTQWNTGMKEVEETTAATATEVEGALAGISGSLQTMGAAIAGLALAEGLKTFAEDAIEASDEIGKFRAAIVALKGDGDNVTQFLDHIHELAATSPFSFPELSATAQHMVQLGVSLEQVQTTLSAVTEMGTALRLPAGSITTIGDALAKIEAGGNAMRTMTALVNQGVPAWQMLAEQMGVSVPAAIEAVKTGAITTQQVVADLTAGMAKYADSAAAWGDTWRGAMKGLQADVTQAMAAVGDSMKSVLNDLVAPLLKQVGDLVLQFADWWKGLSAPVQDAIMAFGAAVIAIAAVGGAIALLGVALEAIGAPFLAATVAIAAVVAALVALGVWVSEHWPAISDILTNTWNQLSAIWGATWNTISTELQAIWTNLQTFAVSFFGALGNLVSVVWNAVSTFWVAVWNGIVTMLKTQWDLLNTLVGTVFGQIGSYLGGFWDPIFKYFQDAWNSIIGWLSEAWNKLASTASILTGAFNNISAELQKSVPAVDATTDAHKKLGGAMADNTDFSTKLGTATQALTDKFIPLADKGELLRAIYQQLETEHQNLVKTVAANILASEALAAAHQTLIDKVMALVPPTIDATQAIDQLSVRAQHLMDTLALGATTVERARQALANMGVESTGAAQKALDLATQQEATVKAAGDMMSTFDNLSAQANTLKANIALLTRTEGDHTTELESLQAALKATEAAISSMSTTTQDAYHQMGIKSLDELNAMATAADENFQKIAASADANSLAVKEAWITKTQDAYNVIIAAGGSLTEAQKAQLDQMKVDVQTHLDSTKSQWLTTYNDITKGVGKAFDDMITLVVTGKGSFADIMTKMLQDLGEAALKAFIAPFEKAIAKFIATSIADLLGGKGLGGVLDAVKALGKTISDIFSGTASAAAPAAGAAAGAAGAAGQAGTTAAGGVTSVVTSSLSSILGAVGSIGSAIAGIVGDIQTLHTQAVLGQIEESTRYMKIGLVTQSDSLLNDSHMIRNMWSDYTKWTADVLQTYLFQMNVDLDYISGNTHDALPLLSAIADSVTNIPDVLTQGFASLSKGIDTLNVTVTATGVTTAEAARALGNQIAANLTGQLAPVVAA